MKIKWNNMMVIYSAIFLLAFLCLFTIMSFNPNKPLNIQDGKMNLTELDLERNEPFQLNGKWEFYWNQLLTPEDFINNPSPAGFTGYQSVPDTWNNYNIPGINDGTGCATYHLKIKTDGMKGHIYGLKVLTEGTSYKVFANKELLLSAGEVGKTAETSSPQYNAQVAYFYSDSQDIDIVVQVSNFVYSKGGLWRSIEFGSDSQIRQSTTFTLRTEMFVFGMLLLAIFFNLSIFAIYVKDKAILYSTFVGIAFLLRLLFSGEYFITKIFPKISFSCVIYIEYLTILLIPLTLLVLAQYLYNKQFSRKAFEIISILVLSIYVSELILPMYWYTQLVNFEIVFGSLIILYIIFTLLFGILKKQINEESFPFLISNIILCCCFLIQALDSKNLIQNRQLLFLVSIIGVILLQMFITSARFFMTYMNAKTSYSDVKELMNKKNEFFAYTYHELDIPLEGLVSLTDMIIRDEEIDNCRNIKNNMILMKQIETNLSDLITDIFDYAQFKGGSIKLEKKAFELENIVEYAIHEVNWKAHEKEVKIVVDDRAKSMIVTADEYKLIGIIHYILDILIERSHLSGLIKVVIQREGENACLIMYANEVMISEEKLKKFMNSSAKEKLEYSKSDNKVCLKITTAMEIARAHGGDLLIGHTFSNDSEIKLIIPIGKENENIGLENSNSYIELSGSSEEIVTIIDSQYSHLSGIAAILNSQGYTVRGYTDSEEGLKEILGNRKTDIAIVDLVLPHISGYLICQKIREQFTVYELPILLTSGRMNRSSVIEGLSFGANDVILKPFEPEELVARINTLKNLKDSTEHAIGIEMAMLQAQINPHFLHNVMNTLAACILNKSDAESVYDIVATLSDYLRLCYKLKPENKLLPLDNEVELVRNYLALEKLRFGERLTYIIDFEDTAEILIPPLIIQPLVENSVQHGIFSAAEGGRIEVHGKNVEGAYQITVEDNGTGIPQNIIDDVMLDLGSNKAIGIGLSNVRKRIMKKYGTELQIESTVGKGTKISYEIKLDL